MPAYAGNVGVSLKAAYSVHFSLSGHYRHASEPGPVDDFASRL